MNHTDFIIILLYLTSMILLSIYVGRGQKGTDDYYVGGRKITWWAVGISTMATQTSAISFISIPAFVAIREGGGLTWLQYELGVPLAMIVVISLLVPYFRRLKLVSIYSYLEARFNPSVRKLVGIVFLISRGVSTGAGVYAIAIVLSVCLNISTGLTIIIIGVTTIVYDTIGGIKAVIYSDVIQTVVLAGGIFLCVGYSIIEVGGINEVFTVFPPERTSALDFSIGLSNDSSGIPFWAFLFGGIFMYISYYGTDQSQVQRELSAGSVEETRKSLVFNGMARFPLTLLYVLMGICMYAVYIQSPELKKAVAAEGPDYLVPFYILQLAAIPRGIIFAALLAAAMSSLDSALNSLSAISMHDFILKSRWRIKDELATSRIVTVIWGAMITLFAFFVEDIADTIIEAINKIGSAFYGPILAAFVIGILSKRKYRKEIFIGILSGVLFNLGLWMFFKQVHFMWWNLFGFMVTVFITVILNQSRQPEYVNLSKEPYPHKKMLVANRNYIFVLTGYFALILFLLFLIS